MTVSLFGLTAESYTKHALHRDERAFGESNCYVDLFIEVLHTLGLESVACLGFTAAIDFEGDQFTFYKPPFADLFDLYGIEVQELNIWRPLLAHAIEQLQQNKLVMTEADAFYLPDTSGTDYRTQHTKTTIGIETIDAESQRLGYFHNGGYYALSGADFQGVFRLAPTYNDTGALPLFAEIVKLGRIIHRSHADLVDCSLGLLRAHLSRPLRHNPMAAFAKRFDSDLAWLRTQALATYHAWAFATLRQCGSGFGLLAHYLRWLAENDHPAFAAAAADFDSIADNSKAFILKGARAVSTKRPADFSPILSSMAASWESGMARLLASRDG